MDQQEPQKDFVDVVEVFWPTKAPSKDAIQFAFRLQNGQILKLALTGKLANELATRLWLVTGHVRE